jgi:predicted metalloprotease with PDZ domain
MSTRSLGVMIKIFLSLLIILVMVVQAEARQINYIVNVKENYIELTLKLKGNSDGKTQFKLPTIFQIDPSQPKNIKIYVDNCERKAIINDAFIDLIHQPSADISISYQLHNLQEEYSDSNLYFNISPKQFFMFNQYCLLIPELLFNELNQIKFEFLGRNNKIFSNLGNEGGKKIYLSSKISDIEGSFFGGGHINSCRLDKFNSKIIFIGEIPISKKTLIKYVSRVYSIHNNFFSDKRKKYYIFFVDQNSSNNIHGSYNSNFFAISLGHKLKFNYELQHIIAHENLHAWFDPMFLGQYKNIQGVNSWLIEGFSDYYADYLNYKNGLLSLDKYLEVYNQAIVDYYASPLQFLTNEEIAKEPFNTTTFNIAYLRGRIIAHELNYLIQKLSNRKLSLNDYIKYLIFLSQTKIGFNFTLEYFNKSLKDFTSLDLSHFINKNIQKNNLLIEAQTILDGKAIIRMKKFKLIKYDFNYLKSRLNWKVQGVSLGSQAFKAGLRNGQKILEIIVREEEVFFKVLDFGKSRLIKLKPEYQEIFLPQYRELRV